MIALVRQGFVLGSASQAQDTDYVSQTPEVSKVGGMSPTGITVLKQRLPWEKAHSLVMRLLEQSGTSPHICNATPSMVCQKIAPQIILL